jgi:hypothetical protein
MALQTFPHLHNHYIPERPAQVWTVNYICKYKAVQLKSKLQHPRTWLTAALHPHCLCHHPAVFFCHLHLIALSFQQEKVNTLQKELLLCLFLYFFRTVYVLKQNNFKLWGSVCTFHLNNGNYQPNNTSSHAKRPEYLTTWLQEPRNSKFYVSLIYTLLKWTSFWLACNHYDICPTWNALICCYTALWTAMATAKSCHSKG